MNNLSSHQLRDRGAITDMAMFALDVQPAATASKLITILLWFILKKITVSFWQ